MISELRVEIPLSSLQSMIYSPIGGLTVNLCREDFAWR
jgi:hypothetical protein